MAKRQLPAPEVLRKLLNYDPETGKLVWRTKPNRKIVVGREAGYIDPRGYRRIDVRGQTFAAHRLAWLLHYGEWPSAQIDHINGVPSDNRVHNLREATNQQNAKNTRVRSDSLTGYKGVSFCKARGVYHAGICANGKRRYLGAFQTAQLAAAAYDAAAIALHGEFARTNASEGLI